MRREILEGRRPRRLATTLNNGGGAAASPAAGTNVPLVVFEPETFVRGAGEAAGPPWTPRRRI